MQALDKHVTAVSAAARGNAADAQQSAGSQAHVAAVERAGRGVDAAGGGEIVIGFDSDTTALECGCIEAPVHVHAAVHFGEDIAAQILPVIGKSVHLQLGYQINMLLYTTNINAFYADTLPNALAQGLDKLDGVIACNPVTKGCAPVNIGQALVVTLVWALILGGVSTYLFIKRDVLQ